MAPDNGYKNCINLAVQWDGKQKFTIALKFAKTCWGIASFLSFSDLHRKNWYLPNSMKRNISNIYNRVGIVSLIPILLLSVLTVLR